MGIRLSSLVNASTAHSKSPLSMNTAPLFKWNAAVGAAVTFGIGTVVGEPLFVVSDWE